MKCALVHSITSPENFKIINVLEVLEAIKTEQYKALIDALPRADTDKKAYTEAKRHLPSWALNGHFDGKVINSGFVESNGLFHIDIDGLENPTATKYQLARDIPEVYALWISPSGTGLKGLLRIPDDFIHDDTDFKKAFEQINEFLAIYDIEIDKSCKDVRRLCFVCSDSDIYINEAAPAFVFDAVKWDYKPIVKPAAPSVQSVSSNQSDRYINRCCDMILNAGAGNYHNARLRAGRLAGGFIAAGFVNEHNIMQALSDASDAISAQHNDKQDVIQREQKTIYDAIQHGKGQPVEQEYRQQTSGQQVSNVLYPDFEKNELDTIPPATEKEIEQHDFDYEPEPRPTFVNPTAPLPIKHLSAICDYINAPIYYYSPKATQHAALAIICHIVSRRFLSDGGDKCSLMIGNVGATVSQLADINNSIEALFCEIGQDDDVRLDRMSHIDLTTHFTNEGSSGKLLYLPTDLGAMIRASQKQTSLAMDGFLSELMQFHDKERHTFRTSKARAKVEIPVINSYANFDDKDLFTFGRASNNDGLFNLFLTQLNDSKDFIFNEKKHRPLTNTDSFTQLKEHIIQLTDKSSGLLPAVKTPNAAAAVIPWSVNPNAYAEKLKTAAGGGKTCGRVMKQFVNLTTAIAAWNGDNAVTEQLAGVCCDYVCYRVSEMYEALKKREKDDIAPDVMSRVLSVIHRAGNEGISESRLIQSCAGFRRLTDTEREKMIDALLKNKEITMTENDGSNGGRKGKKFFIR